MIYRHRDQVSSKRFPEAHCVRFIVLLEPESRQIGYIGLLSYFDFFVASSTMRDGLS